MQLLIDSAGRVRCLYGEELDLRRLGRLSLSRASHVEPDAEGRWFADLSPVGGPVLGPFDRRSEALAAEREWLEARLGGRPPNRWAHGPSEALLASSADGST